MKTAERIKDIYRPVALRIQDYQEVERNLVTEELFTQAGRCMSCGIPFCHGLGCPLGNRIPDMVAQVKNGRWLEAWKILSSTSCFPEFTARVCPGLCENACTNNIDTEPVMVRQIEKAVVETAFENNYITTAAAEFNGKKVGVIGSGPAGLAAAHTLNRLGYAVTVYEKSINPGGLLRYGIPDFKLNKKVIDRRIKLMELSGVEFICGTEVGQDISPAYLQKKYDALVIAVGTPVARDINIPGRGLKNIHFALDYLTGQNRLLAGEINITPVSAENRDVVIIGGGDTGSDCLGTALRQKAKSVVQIDIMPEPPVNRSPSTPWPDWAYQRRLSSSHREGGSQLWACSPQAFTGVNGKVNGVSVTNLDWEFTPEGKPLKFKETEGDSRILKADLVLLAMGFTGVVPEGLSEGLGLTVDSRGRLLGRQEEGIFICGDARTGQSLVVKCMTDGGNTAFQVHDFLGGR